MALASRWRVCCALRQKKRRRDAGATRETGFALGLAELFVRDGAEDGYGEVRH